MANVFSRIAETLFFGYICWLWQRSIDYPVCFFPRRSADIPIFSRLKEWLWDLLSRVNLTDVFIRDPVNSLPSVGSLWGNEKNKEIGIRRVREFFHQEKRTEVLFSLSKNISESKPISTWSFVFSTPGDRLLLRTFKLYLVWRDFSIAKNGPWNKLDSGVKIMK